MNMQNKLNIVLDYEQIAIQRDFALDLTSANVSHSMDTTVTLRVTKIKYRFKV